MSIQNENINFIFKYSLFHFHYICHLDSLDTHGSLNRLQWILKLTTMEDTFFLQDIYYDLGLDKICKQISDKPLQQRILSDFQLSKFIVCTDAGLASNSNRLFNNKNERAFIVTQSLKKLKDHLKKWALNLNDWHIPGSTKKINLNTINHTSDNKVIYYKERWIKENGLEQKLIVTYSPKYKAYQQSIRNSQILRAEKLVKNPSSLNKKKQNDPKRFIDSVHCTSEGEIAENQILTINDDIICDEEQFDGFYGVCTNLEDEPEAIIKINQRRWEIEETFRILKTSLKQDQYT